MRHDYDWIRGMRTILFLAFILLNLSSAPAYAEWTFLTADGKGNTVYFDLGTLLRKGPFVNLWVLLDARTVHETIEGKPFLSSRTLHQYDCVKERFRFLAFALFSDNMGSGQVVGSNHTVLDWERVPKKGSTRRLLEMVCKK